MADSNAGVAPRKRLKLSDESPTDRKKAETAASEEVSFIMVRDEGAGSDTLGHKRKLVSTQVH